MTAWWIETELERDCHALWRWYGFLQRTGRQEWDPQGIQGLLEEYMQDRGVQAAIASSAYHQQPRSRWASRPTAVDDEEEQERAYG